MLSGRWLGKSKSPAGSGALQSVSAGCTRHACQATLGYVVPGLVSILQKYSKSTHYALIYGWTVARRTGESNPSGCFQPSNAWQACPVPTLEVSSEAAPATKRMLM